MKLNFEKVGNSYIAEFEASGDFNLHIERDKNESGYLYVQQRSISEGEYDSIHGAEFTSASPVIDVDFTGVVYPKYIRVVSFSMPTMGVATFA